MKKLTIFTLCITSFILSGCVGQKIVYKEILIPTKCEVPEREKPKRENYADFTDFQVFLRAYYKNIESDLYFCRTGKRLEAKDKEKEAKREYTAPP